MLNVAVSRAKDAFLVFGDMDLFSTASPGSPRRLLGEFLFARPDNAMAFDALERDDLARPGHDIRTLRDAREHDAFLLDLLGSAGSAKVSIVSPWIVVPTMEGAGILPALEAARKRGMEIDVYVDPELNGEADGNGVSNLVSGIETGRIVPRYDTLIDLLRVLDRNLALVPRELVPVVQSLVRDYRNQQSSGADRERPLYAAIGDDDGDEEAHREHGSRR